MVRLSKLISAVIIFSCLASPVSGMERENVRKVLDMISYEPDQINESTNQINKFIEDNDNASIIALGVLDNLRKQEGVPHSIIDMLIGYVPKSDLGGYLTAHPGHECSYVTIKMRAKVGEASDSAHLSSDEFVKECENLIERGERIENLFESDEEYRKWQSYRDKKGFITASEINSTASETLPDRHDDDSDTSDLSNTSPDDSDDDAVNDLLNRISQSQKRSTDTTTAHVPLKKRLDEMRAKRNAMKSNNPKTFSSYIKWGGLCVGISGLVYYLYSRKNKPAAE